MRREEFINELRIFAKSLEYKFHSNKESITLCFNGYTGMNLSISIGKNEKPQFSLWFKTNSSYYIDERTDIHDTISIAYAIVLRGLGICSSLLFDICHPVLPELYRTEIYARYLVPTQLGQEYFKIEHDSLTAFKILIAQLYIFEEKVWNIFGCPCEQCQQLTKSSDTNKVWIDNNFEDKVRNALGPTKFYNSKARKLQGWKYYRDFKRKISIVESNPLVSFLKIVIRGIDKQDLEGINCQLYFTDRIRNSISLSHINRAKSLLNKLEGKANRKENFEYLPLENKLVFLGKSHLLTLDVLGGLEQFKRNRDKLKERHDNEFKSLFAPIEIKWNEISNGFSFENLIKDLLEREPKVSWVRKFANTNEPDGGRDLIANWMFPKNSSDKLNEKSKPYKEINVIIQCKASNKGIGKSKVRDIRDTIELNNYQGYFLAVSSYVTKSLTEHLDKLRTQTNYWVDWWTREEIDERVKCNPDLHCKYSDLFVVSE